MYRWLAVLALAILAVVTAACGDATADDGPVMQMFDNRYAPDVLVVPAGSTVAFPNDGRVNHNVIDAGGTFDSREPLGLDQKPDDVWSYTFTEPGTYQIFCSLHAVKNKDGVWEGMVSTLTVTPAN